MKIAYSLLLCVVAATVFCGCQATHMAAQRGDVKALEAALDRGQPINELGHITRGTPLWKAACRGHVDVVRFLLQRGADPNMGLNKPLECAAGDGNPTIVRLLLENGAVPTDAAVKAANEKGYRTIADMIREHQSRPPGKPAASMPPIRPGKSEEYVQERPGVSQSLASGKYYALVIGNNDYRNLPALKTARRDAQAMAGILENNYGFQVQLLFDAKRSDILTAMAKYRESLTNRDSLLIYYAGHGWLDEEGDEGYWLPVDATRDNEVNWISNSSVTTQLKAMEAKHVLVVADSCYSGKLGRAVHIQKRTPEYYSRVAEKRSRTVIASGGLEPVIDSGGKGNHSVFASALLEALQDNKDVIDSTELFNRIRRPVVLNADQTPEYADIRKAGHEGGEFIFVRKK